jgi:methionyl-tRNA formyltransferase
MLRVVFMGTPDFAVPTLAEVIGAGHEVAAVYTQPPRPAGRGMDVTRSPVHTFAEASGLAVLTPGSLKGAAEQGAFAAYRSDVAVVVAYGLLLPRQILEAPRHGCLNLHGSRLPRWRGAAPVQRAIMAGDTDTAVTVMRMEQGLDTGPVCLAEQIPIGPDMTAGELHDLMAVQGAGLMVRALAALGRGTLTATAQPTDSVTYARKIDKAETRIDFTRSATEVHNHIRGLSPHPGAWLSLGACRSAERVKVLRSTLAAGSGAPGTVLDAAGTIACGTGAIRLVEVQRAGKRPMPIAEFLRGRPLSVGEIVNTGAA